MSERSNEHFTNNSYAYEEGMRAVEKKAQEKGGIARLVNERGRTLSIDEYDEFAIMSALALQLERRDQDDPSLQTSKAALKGTVTGLLVAEAAYGELVNTKEILEAIDIKNEITTGSEHGRQQLNETLIGIGDAALDQMVAAEDLIGQWESACVDDPAYQHYYRIGFGLVMGSAHKAVYSKHLDFLHHELARVHAYDWDQAFIDMNKFDL